MKWLRIPKFIDADKAIVVSVALVWAYGLWMKWFGWLSAVVAMRLLILRGAMGELGGDYDTG